MSDSSSNMVRALVLRELEAGQRDDGLWLQAMSESKTVSYTHLTLPTICSV